MLSSFVGECSTKIILLLRALPDIGDETGEPAMDATKASA